MGRSTCSSSTTTPSLKRTASWRITSPPGTMFSVAFTRCWNGQKGFTGEFGACERRATSLLQSLPQVVSEALDAKKEAQSTCHKLRGDCAQAIRQEKNYQHNRGDKPGWISCRRCTSRSGAPMEFPNDIGVLNQFAGAALTTHLLLQSPRNPQ